MGRGPGSEPSKQCGREAGASSPANTPASLCLSYSVESRTHPAPSRAVGCGEDDAPGLQAPSRSSPDGPAAVRASPSNTGSPAASAWCRAVARTCNQTLPPRLEVPSGQEPWPWLELN